MSSAQLVKNRFKTLQSTITDLHQDYSADGIRNKLYGIADRINTIEGDGYHFLGSARADLGNAARSIEETAHEIEAILVSAKGDLTKRLQYVSSVVAGMNDDNEKTVEKADNALDELEQNVDQFVNKLKSLTEIPRSLIYQIEYRLDYVKKTLDKRDEAGFEFGGDEQLILADRAEWFNDDDDPDGFLYLTSQRLAFEQKEKTGKRLGMFGGKMQQELEWAIPLSEISDAQESDEGLLGGKSMLAVSAGGKEYRLEIKKGGRNDLWDQLLKLAIAGKLKPEQGDAHKIIAGTDSA